METNVALLQITWLNCGKSAATDPRRGQVGEGPGNCLQCFNVGCRRHPCPPPSPDIRICKATRRNIVGRKEGRRKIRCKFRWTMGKRGGQGWLGLFAGWNAKIEECNFHTISYPSFQTYSAMKKQFRSKNNTVYFMQTKKGLRVDFSDCFVLPTTEQVVTFQR